MKRVQVSSPEMVILTGSMELAREDENPCRWKGEARHLVMEGLDLWRDVEKWWKGERSKQAS